MSINLPDVNELADIVVRTADRILISAFREVAAITKADGSVVTEADLAMQNELQQQLAQRWPEFDFLGEETSAEEQAQILKQGTSLWCVDPLDGTTNFAAGVPFFSVSVALLSDAQSVLGLVYDPMLRECYTAVRGEGARLNGKALKTRSDEMALSSCVANVDFKRLKPELADHIISTTPYRSQRNFGSCALEWCWLAASRLQLYLHGGMKLWDYAAGSLILAEAGGAACTLEGEADFRAIPGSRSVVAAQNPGLLAAWKDYLNVPVSEV